MSVMEPKLGDLIDRLFIVERKLLEHPTEDEDLKTERDQAQDAIVATGQTQNVLAAVRLCAINALIWQRTDEVRDSLGQVEMPPDMGRAGRAEKALTLIHFNDLRHVIVDELNSVS